MLYLKNDITGAIGIFNNPQPGWTALTTAEKDDYLLNGTNGAKPNKVMELKIDLAAFRGLGFVYTSWTFNLSERSALYAKSKNDSEDTTGSDRYKYSDINYVQRDFTDNTGFNGFSQAMTDEEDRIMVLYNNYRGQIAACTTIAQVDAITISFSA